MTCESRFLLRFSIILLSGFLAGCQKESEIAQVETVQVETAQTEAAPEEMDRTAPLSFDDLELLGAAIVRADDRSVSSIDFSPLSEDRRRIKIEETPEALQSVRVVRGNKTLGDELAASLTAMPRLTELLWIETDASENALRSIGTIRGLKKLRLAGLQTTPESTKILASLPSLADLDLSGSSIADSDLIELAKSPKLTKLNLYQTGVGDAGVENLRPLAGRLESLNLDATRLTDAGVQPLAAFEKLTFLHLGRTAITDAAVETLATLKNLKKLHVTRTQITESGAKRLADALPACEVIAVAETSK